MRSCDQFGPAPWESAPKLSAFAAAPLGQHGGECGEEMFQSSGFAHQETFSPGVHHPVLLPPEGKTFRPIVANKSCL